MPATGREVVAALGAAVRTWGGRRRTPEHAHRLGPDSLAGAVLDHLGLTDLVPGGRRMLWQLPEEHPLPRSLDPEARRLLTVVCELDAIGRNWGFIRNHVRGLSADAAVQREAS